MVAPLEQVKKMGSSLKGVFSLFGAKLGLQATAATHREKSGVNLFLPMLVSGSTGGVLNSLNASSGAVIPRSTTSLASMISPASTKVAARTTYKRDEDFSLTLTPVYDVVSIARASQQAHKTSKPTVLQSGVMLDFGNAFAYQKPSTFFNASPRLGLDLNTFAQAAASKSARAGFPTNKFTLLGSDPQLLEQFIRVAEGQGLVITNKPAILGKQPPAKKLLKKPSPQVTGLSPQDLAQDLGLGLSPR